MDGFIEYLKIEALVSEKNHVELQMPILPEFLQPFGFLHGGATIALLESAASAGATNNTNLEVERPFGVEVTVRHRKSGKAGMLRGVADLEKVEGNKQYWKVVAYDDEGDIVSEGEVICKIVSLERLAQKARAAEGTQEKD